MDLLKDTTPPISCLDTILLSIARFYKMLMIC